jgi:hypothetical protein
MRARLAAVVGVAVMIAWTAQMAAQQFPPRGGVPPPTPRASAAIDLTGVWVSIVNEDWRWRMITAPRGDFPGLPLSPAGRAAAMAWDPKTDGSCKAFGAAALMRMPTRVRIAWADDSTLKIETDNGQQTRLLHFGGERRAAAPSLQGDSTAEWQRTLAPNNPFGINFPGGPPPPPGGSLRVVTTNLAGGWLRRNGVPYSGRTTVTENFDRFPGPDTSEWFVVTTQVVDPEYLLGRLVTSSHFRRESDASKWSPKPCKAV